VDTLCICYVAYMRYISLMVRHMYWMTTDTTILHRIFEICGPEYYKSDYKITTEQLHSDCSYLGAVPARMQVILVLLQSRSLTYPRMTFLRSGITIGLTRGITSCSAWLHGIPPGFEGLFAVIGLLAVAYLMKIEKR